MRKIYYAKSISKNGSHPTVKQHLKDVSEKASEYGRSICFEEEARVAGLFHDFGKYSERFQGVLAGRNSNIDHATGGAAILRFLISNAKIEDPPDTFRAVIEAVYAHHDGLHYYEMIKDALREVLLSDRPMENHAGKYSSLAGKAEYNQALAALKNDFPDMVFPKPRAFCSLNLSGIEYMLMTRMIFSCLVDADYSVSASDNDGSYFERAEIAAFEPEKWLENLYRLRDVKKSSSNADKTVKLLRDEVFSICGNMGENDPGLFTLTAPTGTGKTLALLHFALRHAIHTGQKRIIIVLPYLSIAEQNAKDYRVIVPDLLEDHSQVDLSDDRLELSSKWSSPFIITTSVRFFESLFRDKPKDCRKIHNIANSVIIFDEAQSLPAELIGFTLSAVNELCRMYGSTVVFSTATQPDFSSVKGVSWKAQEIIPNNDKLYDALKRVSVTWQLDTPVSMEETAYKMSRHSNICVIVNLRDHARKLYRILKTICSPDEVFFLTTDMCPIHRLEQIERIKTRQQADLPCRVVSTQCIEAGVDLDFDVMYRALAPLESIIQAAGRCNRNGKRTDLGNVTVFVPDEDRLYPEHWYGNAAEAVKRMNSEGPLDINDPATVKRYYQEIFSHQKDRKELADAVEEIDYERVCKEYKLITSRGDQVIVPFKSETKPYGFERELIKDGILTKKIMRDAAPFCVNSTEKDIERWAEPLYYRLPNGEKAESGWYILREQYSRLYSADMGLQFSESVPSVENNALIL